MKQICARWRRRDWAGLCCTRGTGFLTPYMGEEWMRRMETCCAEAKSLGMSGVGTV